MTPATTLRMPSGSWPRWFTAAGLLLALAGCGGTGPAGAAGSSATTTAESGITTGTTLTAVDNSPGVVVAITSVTGQTGAGGNFQVGDVPVVTFTVKKTNGTAWHLNEMASGGILISGPTFNYQRVVPKLSDVITRSVANGNGSYTYTFASGIPATYAAPYNDSATYGANDGELQGQALLAGTYTVGLAITWSYTVDGVAHRDAGNATQDFLLGATAVSAAREVVKNDNCNACHVKIQAHGGSYQTTKMCVLCHTAGAQDESAAYPSAGGVAGTRVEFKMMIHRIHNGGHLPSVNGVASNADGTRNYAATPVLDVIVGRNGSLTDFSPVLFPIWPSYSSAMPRHTGYSGLTTAQKAQETLVLKGVVACYKCHGDPDGAGPLTAPAQGNNCYTQPSRRACGSCHDDINFANPYQNNGMTMPAQADDTACATCHATTGTTSADGIVIPSVGTEPATPFAHVHPLGDPTRIAGVTGYDNGLNMSITTVTGSALAYFVAGEKPAITFTVKDNAGVDVPLYRLSSISSTVTGPTNNRQDVFPIKAGVTGNTIPLCDFSGRLVAASTTNKGIMSRVVGSTASETLKVQFTSATAFTVTGGGSALTALGGSALPASPSTNATGTSVSAIELTSAAVAQTITVNFSSATAFTVTGSVSGAMGGGTMPATVSAVTRFTSTDGTVSFTITSGTTAFAAGNNIYMTVFQTTSNSHRFAIVAGRTSFAAGDRFYYETVNNALTTYAYQLPMDMVQEYLGDGATGVAGEVFTAANLPVYWGRETVYERTAMPAGTTLSVAAASRDTSVTLASVAGLAAGGYVVLDHGVAGAEEYLGILSITGTKVYLTTQLRFAHASGAACNGVTLTQRYETTDYTLNPATGAITTVTPVTAGNAIVVNYRTDGAFGWKRFAGDAPQAVYPLTLEDSANLGQDWGKWGGLSYQNGTYTAALWGSLPIYLTQHNETQAYSLTAKAAQGNFLYGAAGTVTPYGIISSQDNCDKCHDGVLFHGGSRHSMDACLTCHGIAGAEDNTRTGITVNFRTMLHKAHMGADLTNASTYSINGSVGLFKNIDFPVMPGKAKACDSCHGAGNTAWDVIATRAHAAQTVPTKNWMVVCTSCHDAATTATHSAAMTTNGVESCVTCHGVGQAFGVDTVHKNR